MLPFCHARLGGLETAPIDNQNPPWRLMGLCSQVCCLTVDWETCRRFRRKVLRPVMGNQLLPPRVLLLPSTALEVHTHMITNMYVYMYICIHVFAYAHT